MTPTEAAIYVVNSFFSRKEGNGASIQLVPDGHTNEIIITVCTIDRHYKQQQQRDRYEKALRDVHEGASRQLAEPRNHDNDQYALTAIATRVEEALRCE